MSYTVIKDINTQLYYYDRISKDNLIRNALIMFFLKRRQGIVHKFK